MFSAIRLGDQIYILNKSDSPLLKVGTVLSTTAINPYMLNSTLDINVKIDNDVIEFKLLPGSLCIANYNNGNTVISETRELMSKEIENMIRLSKDVIDNILYHLNIITNGEEILKSLNPQYAKEKVQEEKIDKLESKVGGIENKLDSIQELLSKIVQK